jgi:hypothetical protein
MMARVEAQWQDEAGTENTTRGKIEDASEKGFCIRLDVPIGVGTKVTVRSRIGNFSGTVVNSRQFGRSYVLGVKRGPAQELEAK